MRQTSHLFLAIALMVPALELWPPAAEVDGRKAEATQEIEQQSQWQQQATAEQIENFKKAFGVCLEAKEYLVEL